METRKLFESVQLGEMHLVNRVVMAPMTRSRSRQPGDIPNELMALYYAQRASAGLQVTEAIQISRQGQGYSFTPGLYSEPQVQGWSRVTEAVHAKGGKIFAQLWHVGRMSHPVFHNGSAPVAPSALAPDARVWIVGEDGVGRMVECPIPRALEIREIAAIVDDYRVAARNAVRAGFDGVEIHGGNGYLIDQFLRTTSNHRTDEYGGTRANRLRFLLEVADAVAAEIGARRVGVRLAPYITARNMNCPDIVPTILDAAAALSAKGLAYLHLVEADWDDAPEISDGFRVALRSAFQGAIIVAGRYHAEKAEAILRKGLADLVAFGRAFIANPDLPDRLRQGWPLAEADHASLFGGNDHGYTDYPTFLQATGMVIADDLDA